MAPMAMAVRAGGDSTVPDGADGGNGAQAGALSPFAPTGIIVNGNMDKIGLAGHETQTFLNNLMAHAVVTFVAYFLLAAGDCSRGDAPPVG